jgi:hypothetical protein
MRIYSPFTIATEGGGVAVGGIGMRVGIWGVGVPGLRKDEKQDQNLV